MSDTRGRAYLSVTEVRPGLSVVADGGFTCMRRGRCVIRQDDEGSLYIECSAGRHHLDGQLFDDETHYIGLYPVAWG